MKTKISKIGRRGKIVLTLLVAVMFIGIASAAILPYYNKVTTTAHASQSVLVDGKNHTVSITNEYDIIAGCCKSSCHLLENQACVNAPIEFNTISDDPNNITTTYYTPTYYSFAEQAVPSLEKSGDPLPVLISVENGECDITWTIDWPVEGDLGNGNMGVAIIIAKNGDGNGPSFQIHNNDGTDANYQWGTWLLSPWGPTIDDGWFGWHSGSTNVPVSELDWVECTGHRYKDGKVDDPTPNPDGIFTITIPKCNLGDEFHWAIHLGCGGFYNIAGYASYPKSLSPYGFDWSNPIVDMTIAQNYEPATIMEDLGTGFILGLYQSKEVIICNLFDVGITPGEYTIVSEFVPVKIP